MLTHHSLHRTLKRRSDRGASMVEAMLSSIVLLFLTGALIDVAFGLQRYGDLADSIARLTRVAASAPCSEVYPSERRSDSDSPFSLPRQIRAEVERVTKSPDSVLALQVIDSGFECDRPLFLPPLEEYYHPVLATEVKVRFPCVFCLFFGGIEMNLSTRSPVEDTSMTCGYPVSCG